MYYYNDKLYFLGSANDDYGIIIELDWQAVGDSMLYSDSLNTLTKTNFFTTL